MKLITQTNSWSCLLYAFAIVLREDPKTLIEEIGHDGSNILWPTLPEPHCRQSFHLQEMIDCCFRRNLLVMQVEAVPERITMFHQAAVDEAIRKSMEQQTLHSGQLAANIDSLIDTEVPMVYMDVTMSMERLQFYLEGREGVITCTYGNKFHAVAWDGHQVFDPAGHIRGLYHYGPIDFYIIK